MWKFIKKYDWIFVLLADILVLIGICIYIRLSGNGWWAVPLWFILNIAILNGLQYQNQRDWADLHEEIFGGRPWYK